MIPLLRDVTGFRGEKIVELCLTDFSSFPLPLFRPGFLGDKWPAVDFLVELTSNQGRGMYFFVQSKATISTIYRGMIRISSDREDIERLLMIPAPTYLLGVHEPSKRVFARSIHVGTPRRAITRIPLENELTAANLQVLHDEVVAHWTTIASKPTTSVFR